jgi:ATP-binding cassette subfamily B protein
VAALEKLSGVLDEAPDVPEPEPPAAPAVADRSGGDDHPGGHEVRFDHMDFAYRTNEVLHDLGLVIPAGQTVALVGATGAGKSTVARLMARFYDPTGGRVLLDGVDLRHLSDDTLRASVVTLTQESYLFSGSVADNILFGQPGASRQEAEAAARAIGAQHFIEAVPEGYDTQVHKWGGRLSAGQRQLGGLRPGLPRQPRSAGSRRGDLIARHPL